MKTVITCDNFSKLPLAISTHIGYWVGYTSTDENIHYKWIAGAQTPDEAKENSEAKGLNLNGQVFRTHNYNDINGNRTYLWADGTFSESASFLISQQGVVDMIDKGIASNYRLFNALSAKEKTETMTFKDVNGRRCRRWSSNVFFGSWYPLW